LPYHAAAYSNQTEARFLVQAITEFERPPPGLSSTAGAVLAADSASIELPPGATGVLYKENDYPDWHATVGSVPAPIYPAGPGMMYVPASRPPSTGGTRTTIRFAYQLSNFEWLTTFVTVTTLVGLIVFVLVPKVLWRRTGSVLVASRPGRWVKARLRRLDLVV
jgi:hypothetical protein